MNVLVEEWDPTVIGSEFDRIIEFDMDNCRVFHDAALKAFTQLHGDGGVVSEDGEVVQIDSTIKNVAWTFRRPMARGMVKIMVLTINDEGYVENKDWSEVPSPRYQGMINELKGWNIANFLSWSIHEMVSTGQLTLAKAMVLKMVKDVTGE